MLQEKLEKLIRSTVEGLGYQLWGYEYRPNLDNGMLRIYIDSEKGIIVDDCAAVSEQISAVFDVEEPITSAYTLEVSSPGIDRALFSAKQYKAYIGKTVKIRTRIPLDGRRNYKGSIKSLTETEVTLKIDNEYFDIPFDAIDQARLKIANSIGKKL